ncbi:MAG TPA: phospholipase D family protein [Vicinamibacterales bacterium]
MSSILSLALCAGVLALPGRAAADDQIYFSAVDNVTNVLVQKINAETVRLDISSWYLSEHAISIAIANRFHAGVQVRIIGDRAALFENDVHTKNEFYWLASQGVPIRLRFNPTWFPEINHWKMALFVGQNMVEFGSGNFAPVELAPVSSTNYDDETELFTTDPALVNAFKTKFDVMWNDTTPEPESLVANPPYLKDWNDACAHEPTGGCSDYLTQYPNPVPMVINTARLEGNNPMPVDLIWGQGPDFNNRLTQEINNEQNRIDLVVYRLEVDNITQAILAKFKAGVPIRILVDPAQYTKITWPEYWLTHANIDKLWAAGVPIRQALHDGVTHMKTLVTSTYATNASSNFGPNWQRDHDYFVSATTKPSIYQAIANRVDVMWNDSVGFGPLKLTPPNAASLASPASGATDVAGSTPLTWNTAAWAVSYDVYLGTTQANMAKVANVPAQMVVNPPATYSWTPSTSLQAGATYFWKVVSRTNATALAPTMIATSSVWSFSTVGTAGPPAAPTVPSPATGTTGVSTSPLLTWSSGGATTYDVRFGTANPPPQVYSGQPAASFSPASLTPGVTYFWQIVAHNTAGAATGPVWSFTTGSAAADVVIYANDPGNTAHGFWSMVADGSAAGGAKLSTPDNGAPATNNPAAAPSDYVDVTFNAQANTPYTFWIRLQAVNNSKYNDAVWVQFSDASANGAAVYQINSTNGLLVNLATDSSGSSDVGWGWVNGAYWLTQPATVTFGSGGSHTLRVQAREDGVQFDQIVLSASTYLTPAPGIRTNDSTIVAKPSPPGPPSTPTAPSPSNQATGVATSPTLTWTASGATSFDVRFGTSNPPGSVSTSQSNAAYTPAALANSTKYFWQIVAHNAAGTATGPVWSFTTAAAGPPPPSGDVVIYASDIPAVSLHGNWVVATDPSSPNTTKLVTPDNGLAFTDAALATPTHYVDVTFTAAAGTPYRFWMRMQALNNSKFNDSLWVQFSDALANGSPIYPINSSSGLDVNLAVDSTGNGLSKWGWQNTAYWLSQPTTFTFTTSGTHTLRIQVREDGAQFDQIVLSSGKYLTAAPGPVANDTTIVAKP